MRYNPEMVKDSSWDRFWGIVGPAFVVLTFGRALGIIPNGRFLGQTVVLGFQLRLLASSTDAKTYGAV